ncbi:MAG: hypothetical protein HY654_07925 [Acidobacteria bacterium]|nr:hypothetical protein [Acidobacteriota bacterium]
MIRVRLAIICVLAVMLWPADAGADWHFTPFVGITFGTKTTVVDLERASEATKVIYGGSVSLLGARALGLEIDFGYAPGFFQRDDGAQLVIRSYLLTLTGNVIIAAPRRWTRESLRPYVVGGIGLMHPRSDDVLDVLEVNSRLLGLGIGGGVIGFFTDRTGIRLEVRRFQNLTEGADGGVAFGATRLSYWRASAGVVLRR